MTTPRSRPTTLLPLACSLCSVSLVLAADQVEPPPADSPAPAPGDGVVLFETNTAEDESSTSDDEHLMFSTDFDSLPQTTEMRRRLKDPEQRKLLRAEQREQVRKQNPELAEVLRIDPEREAALIELLTDDQMQHLERFYAVRSGNTHSVFEHGQAQADAETRRLAKLRELLGADLFERYQDYQSTVMQRRHALLFDARLDSYNKLTSDQKERLIVLLQDHFEKEMQQPRIRLQDAVSPFSADREARAEAMRKQAIEMYDETFRDMQQASRLLLERLPEVLTPQQLDIFAQMEAEKIASQRKYVEQMRIRVGMSPEVPEQPAEVRPPARTPVAGHVKLEVSLTVNRSEPVNVILATENGKAVPFEAPEGLWVEATPTLFDDGWLNVDFKFYEGPPGRGRAIAGHHGMGTRTTPDTMGLATAGGGSSVIVGSKGYAVSMQANAVPIP